MALFWQTVQPVTQAAYNVNVNYANEGKLGEGAFGEVYKVRHRWTDNIFALKVVKPDNLREQTLVIREMNTLKMLNHAHIVKLVANYIQLPGLSKFEVYLVLEFCSGGTLNQRLTYASHNNDLKWMSQLADGVAYLHSRQLVHRDLKPDNILFNSNEDIKIGDFGLARDFHGHSTEQGASLQSYYMHYGCGTFSYMAPEVFLNHYTEKADIFSLGILFYAIQERQSIIEDGKICYGAFHYNNNGAVPLGWAMFEQGNGQLFPIEFTNNASKSLVQVISSALSLDHHRRPSAYTIKQHLDYII